MFSFFFNHFMPINGHNKYHDDFSANVFFFMLLVLVFHCVDRWRVKVIKNDVSTGWDPRREGL